jgi:hypothetical protein
MSIKAVEVQVDAEMVPGGYQFLHRDGVRVGIVHGCPCGCGRKTSIKFRGSGLGGDEWDVKGDWPNVTLSPSIGIGKGQGPNGGYHWHGFLEDGFWNER